MEALTWISFIIFDIFVIYSFWKLTNMAIGRKK